MKQIKIAILKKRINVSIPYTDLGLCDLLWEYRIPDEPGIADNSLNVQILPATFPPDIMPATSESYSGFVTHGVDVGNGVEPFLFCFREGSSIFCVRKDSVANYTALIQLMIHDSYKKALQTVLLLESLADSILGVHSVAMEYGGRVVLVSAPSGTGKSTHTEIWRRQFGAKIINGDYGFLEPNGDEILYHGTPFSGSSEYCEKGIWRVSDMVIIRQAKKNQVERLGGHTAYVKIMENSFVPRWDVEKSQMALDLILNIMKNIRIWRLSCTPELEAAVVLRNALFDLT